MSPLKTAVAFIVIVLLLDTIVIAMLVERSFEMFKGVVGTWLPFALIFVSTYITGMAVSQRARRERAGRIVSSGGSAVHLWH